MKLRIEQLSGIVLSVGLLTACGEPATETAPVVAPKSVEFSYMDTTVSPKVDFYQYAAGTWLANNKVPSTESSWSSFNELQKKNTEKMLALLKECSSGNFEKGSPQQLIGDYYHAMMDSVGRNAAGYTPIQADLDKIDALASKKDMAGLIAYNHPNGISSPFSFYIYTDLKDNQTYITYFEQDGLGLPDKDFYFKEDESSVAIREAYKAYMGKLLTMIGYDEANVSKTVENIFKLETELASASMNSLEQRDIEAQYNKMKLADVKALTPSFDFDAYLAGIGIKGQEDFIVGQPKFMKKLEEQIKNVDLAVWKDYFKWNLVRSTASSLSDDFEMANFDFYSKTLRGTQEMQPRWKRSINAMNWIMGEPMGRAFVERHFTAEAKEKVNVMVDNIIYAFSNRIDQLDWMSDSTKMEAKAKLGSFTRKLGYPDKWKDMSSMEISKDSYVANKMAASRFDWNEMIHKLGSDVDKTEWGMPAHIVNAYYNPTMNEIVFPAGIMQPPFFDPEVEDAVNYSRMGAVIGHELTHGFDDQGAKFDGGGNFRDWWRPQDTEQFNERTTKLEQQFNEYSPLEGEHIDGKLTLGENIADLGGLTIAYYAYQKSLEGKEKELIEGFSPEQRFFIAFAQIWKVNYTKEALLQQLRTNPHSPGEYRVKGTLSNMPEFFEAFNIAPGDPMRQPDDKIARIW